MPNPFARRDIISTQDFTKEEIEHLLAVASSMDKLVRDGCSLLSTKIMGSMFLEPSTRTRLSFDTAMKRLGGRTVGLSDWDKSSIKKGETMADTLRVVENYVDVLVLRSVNEGAARYAAEIVDIPVINAGSGAQEHPTQAFLDLMCIKGEKGKVDGLTIGLCGDLTYGRTIHSLLTLLAHYDVSLRLISPPELKIRKEDRMLLEGQGVTFDETESLEGSLPSLDVLYMTRIQRERFPSEEEYLKVKEYYVLNRDAIAAAKAGMIVMHPLPRIKEISPDIDGLPQAVYFKQPKYGLHVRMALLGLIFDVL